MAITRKNDAFVAKMVNTRLTKVFMTIFAPDERLPTSATLDRIKRTILAPSVLYDKHILSKACVDLEMGHEDGGVLDDGSHGDQITPNMLFK